MSSSRAHENVKDSKGWNFTPLFAHPDMEKTKFTTRKTTTQNPKISQQPPPKSIARKAAPNDQRSVTDRKESQQISRQWGVGAVGCLLCFRIRDRSPHAHPASFYSQSFLGLKKTETTPPSKSHGSPIHTPAIQIPHKPRRLFVPKTSTRCWSSVVWLVVPPEKIPRLQHLLITT